MLVFTTLFALITGAIFVFPDSVATVCLMIWNAGLAAALVGCAVYGRNDLRAFGIGGLLPIIALGPFSGQLALEIVSRIADSAATTNDRLW
jgi:hypothetical protein